MVSTSGGEEVLVPAYLIEPGDRFRLDQGAEWQEATEASCRDLTNRDPYARVRLLWPIPVLTHEETKTYEKQVAPHTFAIYRGHPQYCMIPHRHAYHQHRYVYRRKGEDGLTFGAMDCLGFPCPDYPLRPQDEPGAQDEGSTPSA